MRVDLAPPPLIAPTGPDGSRAAGRAHPSPAPGARSGLRPASQIGPVGRRFAAWLIDLLLVAAPTAAVAATQAEIVPLGPGTVPPGSPAWATATVGPTVYRWSGEGLWLTGLAAVLAALIVLTLIPANVEGWTPGLRLMRLRVLTTTGTRARLHHHVVRSLVGVLDLAPFVVPGLLGWVVASRSPLRQRLGDRVAGTVVVDLRHPERPAGPDPSARRKPVPPVSNPSPTDAAPTGAALRWAIDELDAGLAPAISPPTPTIDAPRARAVAVATPRPAPPTTTVTGLGEPAPTAPDAGSDGGDRHGAISWPEWDDTLDAWVVVDGDTGQRFRHDPTSNRWLPVPPG